MFICGFSFVLLMSFRMRMIDDAFTGISEFVQNCIISAHRWYSPCYASLHLLCLTRVSITSNRSIRYRSKSSFTTGFSCPSAFS